MATQPDGGTSETGSDGGDLVGAELRALEARVERCEQRQRQLVRVLARGADLLTGELEHLLAD